MIDLLDPAVDRDPLPWLEELRRQAPVHWSDRHRAWIVVGHEAVVDGFRASWLSSDRTDTFARLAARRPAGFDVVVDLLRSWMVFRDPPAHTRLRDPVRRAFTPRRVADLEPAVERAADDLLDQLAAVDGPVDLRTAYAQPLPALVIAHLLGIPAADRPAFQRWSDELADVVFSAESPVTAAERPVHAARRFTQYFDELAEDRRQRPGDDLVSALVQAPDVEPAEIAGACTLLLFAGHETTAGLIANGASLLLDHPDQLARLHADAAGWPAAAEELTRAAGPAKTMVRKSTARRRWFGVDVSAGDTVFLVLLAANHDPAVFDEPRSLDVSRQPNPHVGFGWGIHHCLGAPLARLETAIALRRLFARFPRLRREAQATWAGGVLGYVVTSVPVTTGA